MRYFREMKLLYSRSRVVKPPKCMRQMKRTVKLWARSQIAIRPFENEIVQQHAHDPWHFDVAMFNSLHNPSEISCAALIDDLLLVDKSVKLKARLHQICVSAMV